MLVYKLNPLNQMLRLQTGLNTGCAGVFCLLALYDVNESTDALPTCCEDLLFMSWLTGGISISYLSRVMLQNSRCHFFCSLRIHWVNMLHCWLKKLQA